MVQWFNGSQGLIWVGQEMSSKGKHHKQVDGKEQDKHRWHSYILQLGYG